MPENVGIAPEKPVTAAGILEKKNFRMADEVGRGAKAINEDIARALIDIAPSQQDVMVKSLGDFANHLHVRAGAENMKDPSRIQTVLDGANALLSPEPSDPEAAKRMIEALELRYGIKR